METALFHLAFPVHDFKLAKEFYHTQLGCSLGRESEHALIMQLGKHQLVAHKVAAELEPQATIYPRHFGLIFQKKEAFDKFIQGLTQQNVDFEIPPKIRFPNTPIEHHSFFLKDPSNNLLEFKFYTNPSAIFGEKEWNKVGELQ